MSDSNTSESDFSIPHPDDLIIETSLLVQKALGEALQHHKNTRLACVLSVLSGKMSPEEAEERVRIVSDLAYSSLTLIDGFLVAVPEKADEPVTRNVRTMTHADGEEETVVAPNSIVRTVEDLRRLPAGSVIRYPLGESWLIAERSRKDESDWFTFLGTIPSEEIGLPAILLAGPVRDNVEGEFLES